MVNDTVFQALAKESHVIGTFGHGFTYSGHPVPAAVAIETLKIYDEMEIGAHVGSVGPYMQTELRRRFADHPLVGEVRGIGLIAAVELVADKASHRNFDPKAEGRRPADQAVRGKRRHRPRGDERCAVFQPAAGDLQGRDRRDAQPGQQVAG